MRGSTSAARCAAQASSSRTPLCTDPHIRKRLPTRLEWTDRNFASTSSYSEPSQAESSQAAARRAPAGRSEEAVDREEEFKKRLRDIQAFRRRKVAARKFDTLLHDQNQRADDRTISQTSKSRSFHPRSTIPQHHPHLSKPLYRPY